MTILTSASDNPKLASWLIPAPEASLPLKESSRPTDIVLGYLQDEVTALYSKDDVIVITDNEHFASGRTKVAKKAMEWFQNIERVALVPIDPPKGNLKKEFDQGSQWNGQTGLLGAVGYHYDAEKAKEALIVPKFDMNLKNVFLE